MLAPGAKVKAILALKALAFSLQRSHENSNFGNDLQTQSQNDAAPDRRESSNYIALFATGPEFGQLAQSFAYFLAPLEMLVSRNMKRDFFGL